MKLVLKYLKPFLGFFIVLNILLFVQAYANLSLPDYMSKMINEGVQNSGLPNKLPDEMDKNLMQALVELNGNNSIEDAYKLTDNKFIIKKLSGEEENNLLRKYNQSAFVLFNLVRDSGQKVDTNKSLSSNEFAKLSIYIKSIDKNQIVKLYEKAEVESNITLSQVGRLLTKYNYVVLGKNIDKIQMSFVAKNAVIMVGFIVLSAVATLIVSFLATFIASAMAKNMRNDIFNKIIGFSQSEYSKFKTSSLITRTTDDITQVQDTIAQVLRLMFYSPIVGIWGFFMAYRMAPSMSFIIGLSILLLLIIIAIVFYLAMPKFEQRQKNKDDINLITRENLTGLLIVRAFNNQNYELNKFDKINKENRSINVFISNLNGFLNTSLNLVMGLTSLAIVFFGGIFISKSNLQIGNMMAFLQYSIQIIISFLLFAVNFIILPRAAVSIHRIGEVLNTEATITEKPDAINKKKIKGDIQFKNVSYKQGKADDYILEDINLDIKAGEQIAIVGSTGSGKTTITNLILRFLDCTSGEVLIDGVNVQDYSLDNLRSQISVSLQKSMLLKGTVESNMQFSKQENREVIKECLELADCNSFLDKKGGLDADIAQLGGNLSGGQKQRLSIARCISKDASIYIFDDSFSALDTTTDAKIRENIKNRLDGKTVIIVAQRLNTIIGADKIIVLDEGRLCGVGRHNELLKSCDVYRELAETQMGGVID